MIHPTHDARAIGALLVERAIQQGQPLQPMAVLKLAYFCHGWCLALLQRPLVAQPVEAGRFGPIHGDLYELLVKTPGEAPEPILAPLAWLSASPDKEQLDIINQCEQAYQGLTGKQMATLAHDEGSPYVIHTNRHPFREEAYPHAIIPDALIYDCFQKLSQEPTKHAESVSHPNSPLREPHALYGHSRGSQGPAKEVSMKLIPLIALILLMGCSEDQEQQAPWQGQDPHLRQLVKLVETAEITRVSDSGSLLDARNKARKEHARYVIGTLTDPFMLQMPSIRAVFLHAEVQPLIRDPLWKMAYLEEYDRFSRMMPIPCGFNREHETQGNIREELTTPEELEQWQQMQENWNQRQEKNPQKN